MKRTLVFALLTLTLSVALLSGNSAAQGSATALLMRNPTVSSTDIVFSYAGDLWIVSRQGGEARRLTLGAGNEANPIFSPTARPWHSRASMTATLTSTRSRRLVEFRSGLPFIQAETTFKDGLRMASAFFLFRVVTQTPEGTRACLRCQ